MRERAYEHLRVADSFMFDLSDAAIEQASRAAELAMRAGDETLAEWSLRVKAVALVHAGRPDEAAALFTTICTNPNVAPDAAWDAGNAFHLEGDLERAVEWYRRALGPEGRPWVGRLKYESLQGLVLALGEMNRWDEAEQEIDRFTSVHVNEFGADTWFRRYVSLRKGAAPLADYDPEQPIDTFRYWALESLLARGADAKATLRAIDGELDLASETRRLVPIARAEALRRLGEQDEALRVARDAHQQLRGYRRRFVLDRAHFDLAAERLARIAEEKGLIAEAQRVRAEAAALRWHPNRMPR